MNESGPRHAEQAHTYSCRDCDANVIATSRPDGCPDCGGQLHNDTLDRHLPTANGGADAHVVFTYECVENDHRTTAADRPAACPDCGSPVRNVTLEQQ